MRPIRSHKLIAAYFVYKILIIIKYCKFVFYMKAKVKSELHDKSFDPFVEVVERQHSYQKCLKFRSDRQEIVK